jgi:hypothetical protein
MTVDGQKPATLRGHAGGGKSYFGVGPSCTGSPHEVREAVMQFPSGRVGEGVQPLGPDASAGLYRQSTRLRWFLMDSCMVSKWSRALLGSAPTR